MRELTIVLAVLACMGLVRQLQASRVSISAAGRASAQSRADAHQPPSNDGCRSKHGSLKALTSFLLALKATAAFNLAGQPLVGGRMPFRIDGTGLTAAHPSMAVTNRLQMKASEEHASVEEESSTRATFKSSVTRKQLLAGGLAATALLVPRVAEASFGSVRSAVVSSAKLWNGVNAKLLQELDPAKRAQWEKMVNDLNLEKDKLQIQVEATLQTGEQRAERERYLRRRLQQASDQVRKLQLQFSYQVARSRMTLAGASQNEQARLASLREQLERRLREQADAKELLQEQIRVTQSMLESARAQLKRKRELEVTIAQKTVTATPEWFNYVAAFVASCVSTTLMHPVDTLKTRKVVAKANANEAALLKKTESEDGVDDSHGMTAVAMSLEEASVRSAIAAPEVVVSLEEASGTSVIAVREAAPAVPQDSAIVELTQNHQASAEHVQPADGWTLEGYLSLYQGITGALLKEGPPSALYLGIYEAAKTQMLSMPSFAPFPILVYFLAGALGETVGSIIRAPAEAIKSRVQSEVDSSTAESFQRVLMDSAGRANIGRAWSASLWRDVPFGGIQLAIFEALKSFLAASPHTFLDIDANSLATEVILAGLGGGIGAFLTTPMDVATTRIMTQGAATGEQECEDEEDCPVPLGFGGMMKELWSEGGWPAFWTGWSERTGYWAPAIGIFLSTYSGIQHAAIDHHLFK